MNIFTQFFKRTQDGSDRRQQIERDLIRREVELSSDIFGKVPDGVRREFFCLDTHTWIWFEEWTDKNNRKKQLTTRYIIRPTEIVKSQNGGAYYRLTIQEAKNFHQATKVYLNRIKKGLYSGSSKQPIAK